MAVDTQGLLNKVYDEATGTLRTSAGSGSGGTPGPAVTDPVATETTLLASAARTADTNTADQTNVNHVGVFVVVNVTAVAASPSVVVRVQGKEPVSGNYYNLLDGTPITDVSGVGMYVFKVTPGIGQVAGGAAADRLPKTWRVLMDHGDADSITYSVSAVLLP